MQLVNITIKFYIIQTKPKLENIY